MKKIGKDPKGYFQKLLGLFLSFLKIGAFSFGGGYTMIAFYEREFVEKRKYLTHDEFTDLLVIAESTPGPIAVNGATYIGYRTCGLLGAMVSTFAACLPAFVIIYLISLFFDKFLQFTYVQYAFRGIQAGVPVLILMAGWKLFVKMKKTVRNVVLFSVVALAMLLTSFFAVAFSSLYYILIGAAVGLITYFVGAVTASKRKKQPPVAPSDPAVEPSDASPEPSDRPLEPNDNGANPSDSEVEK